MGTGAAPQGAARLADTLGMAIPRVLDAAQVLGLLRILAPMDATAARSAGGPAPLESTPGGARPSGQPPRGTSEAGTAPAPAPARSLAPRTPPAAAPPPAASVPPPPIAQLLHLSAALLPQAPAPFANLLQLLVAQVATPPQLADSRALRSRILAQLSPGPGVPAASRAAPEAQFPRVLRELQAWLMPVLSRAAQPTGGSADAHPLRPPGPTLSEPAARQLLQRVNETLTQIQPAPARDRAGATTSSATQAEPQDNRALFAQANLPVQLGDQYHNVQLHLRKPHRSSRTPHSAEWEIQLCMDLPQLGTMGACIRLKAQQVEVQFWSERPGTEARLRAHEPQLRAGLAQRGISLERFGAQVRAPETQAGQSGGRIHVSI